MKKLNILLTNDDNIYSKGIRCLENKFKQIANIFVVAPINEISACSRSFSLKKFIKVCKIDENKFAVHGTSVDCINIAFNGLIKEKIDYVISGINNGLNLSEDIVYSATCGAALEALYYNKKSIAVSLQDTKNIDFNKAANYFLKIFQRFVLKKLNKYNSFCLNINIPDKKNIKYFEITKTGKRKYINSVKKIKISEKESFFYFNGTKVKFAPIPESDSNAIQNNFISVSFLNNDLNDYEMFNIQKKTYKL